MYGGVGTVPFGSDGPRPAIYIGYLNELTLGTSTGLFLSAGLVNSYYNKSNGTSLYSPPSTRAYSLQVSLSAEPRLYISNNYHFVKSLHKTVHAGWFVSLPFEVNSSTLTSTDPFTASLFLGATVGYRHAVSEKFFLEAIGGIGQTYYNLQGLYATPYLRLKACYAL